MGCKVCGSEDMARAHIIPRALMHDIRAGDGHLYIANKFADRYEHSQSGIWDDTILCKGCEHSLSDADNYAVRWIRKFGKNAVPLHGGLAFEVPNSKPALLLKFVASVIWRATASERTNKPDIELGPWEIPLRECVFGSTDYEPRFFVAHLRWTVGGEFHGIVGVPPYRCLLRSRRTFAFEVGNLRFGVQVDRRGQWPEFSDRFCANGKDPLLALNFGDRELTSEESMASIYHQLERTIEEKKPKAR